MKVLVLLIAVILIGCDASVPAQTVAPADSAAGETAISLLGPNEAALVVPVSINGRAPVNFILDTGATLTCIDVSLARVLELPGGEVTNGVAIGAMSAGRVETVRIDSLRIGNAAAYDLLACRLDLAALREALGVQGLIGLNFLKSFDVALDFERRVLPLTRPAD